MNTKVKDNTETRKDRAYAVCAYISEMKGEDNTDVKIELKYRAIKSLDASEYGIDLNLSPEKMLEWLEIVAKDIIDDYCSIKSFDLWVQEAEGVLDGIR